MQIPEYDKNWLKNSGVFSLTVLGSPSSYEWERNLFGLMPLRVNCWMHCWMSEPAWTEWKNYSRPRFNYEASLPGSTPHSVFKSTTLGTRSLFVSVRQQSETSIRVQKSVRQLSTSRSLTIDVLKERLTPTPDFVRSPWSRFVFASVGSKMSGKTSSRSSRSISSSQPWSDENHDPATEIRYWQRRMREDHWNGVWNGVS
jgi:hypothetical protein